MAMKLPAGRRTKKTKSWSTDADTLDELARQGHELPQKLLRFRELGKLKSTYVDALPQLVGADGRLHTRIQQAVAATGRLSSVNPNLQNIPVRTEQGQKIRKAFRAGPGRLLLVADYSQIELRVLAHIAQEPAMIAAFRAGEDIHRTTAASVLGVAPELVNADQRRAAKTINFGLIYGMSAFGLSQALGIPTKETVSEPYTNWRKYSFEELEAEDEARRQAITRGVLGAAAIIGGVVAGSNTNSSAGSAAATAAVLGGAYAIKSGLDKRAEIKLHSDSLKQLGDSFQSEVQPMVVDVEGRTLELKGSAEEQYAEWRRLLKDLYEDETGLSAVTSAASQPVGKATAARP